MSVEEPFDQNGVLAGSYDPALQALRIVTIDPASGISWPKDENGVWSDAFEDGAVRVVFV